MPAVKTNLARQGCTEGQVEYYGIGTTAQAEFASKDNE